MGHEKEREGNEFEFGSSSRSLASNFFGRGEAPVHFEFAFVSASKASRPRGEQFENRSRTQPVMSSRTIEE